MAFVTTLHLQASADAALSCKPVRPITRGGHGMAHLHDHDSYTHLFPFFAPYLGIWKLDNDFPISDEVNLVKVDCKFSSLIASDNNC